VAKFGPELRLELGLIAHGKRRVRLSKGTLRAQLQPGLRLAVQEVRAPVGRYQGAMAPDRAELLPADALPYGAAGIDVRACIEHVSVGGYHQRRDRRLLEVYLAAHPQQHREGRYQQCP
jgi:hypothetical protein